MQLFIRSDLHWASLHQENSQTARSRLSNIGVKKIIETPAAWLVAHCITEILK